MKKEIVTVGSLRDPVLKRKAKKVGSIRLATPVIDMMIDTTYAYQDVAVGLSAPQIGYSYQIITILVNDFHLIINPVLSNISDELEIAEEGCLSLPGVYLPIARPKSVTVSGKDSKGKKMKLDLVGYEARVVIHEHDHLRGRLITDRFKEQMDEGLLDLTFSPISDRIEDQESLLEVI